MLRELGHREPALAAAKRGGGRYNSDLADTVTPIPFDPIWQHH